MKPLSPIGWMLYLLAAPIAGGLCAVGVTLLLEQVVTIQPSPLLALATFLTGFLSSALIYLPLRWFLKRKGYRLFG